MLSSIFQPVILRRVAGGASVVIGLGLAQYYGVDTSGLKDKLNTFQLTLKFAKRSQMGFGSVFEAVKSGDLPLEMISDPEFAFDGSELDLAEYLWRHPTASNLRAIERLLTRVTSPSKILSRCPKLSLLSSISVDKPFYVSSPGGELDLEDFLAVCRQNDPCISPALFLFYVASHCDWLIAHWDQLQIVERKLITDQIVGMSLKCDLAKYRQVFLAIITRLDFENVNHRRKIVEALLDIIVADNDKFDEPLIEETTRIVARHRLDLESDSIVSKLASKPRLFALASELVRRNPKIVFPIDLFENLIAVYFGGLQDESHSLLHLLRHGTTRFSDLPSVTAILSTTLTELERIGGVTDYESEQVRKAVDSAFSRPIVDTELFAFHENSEHTEHRDLSLGTLIERIGILAEILRPTVSQSVANFLLLVAFPLIIDGKSSSVYKTCANLAALARSSSAACQQAFLASTKITGIEEDIFEETQRWRLEHNIKCLRIASAPILIDSLLPISSCNPLEGEIDIVFVHGLRGSLNTWTLSGNEKILWPQKCLQKSRSKDRLLAFTFDAPLWYATHKQHYSEIDLKRNFEEMGNSLAEALHAAHVGKKPIVFVAFSMGGLVVKQALIDDPVLRKNCAGIVFIATPHLGSPIADYAYWAGSLVSPFVPDLSRKSKQVDTLHEKFMELSPTIKTLSICETAPTPLASGIKATIVSLDSCSACRENGIVIMAPEATDHDHVSKVNPDLMDKDPRVIAILEFLNTI